MRQAFAVLLAFAALTGSARAQGSGPDIPWETCPCDGALGTMAHVAVPEGFLFGGADATRMFMEATQNPVSGNELGVILKPGPEGWFVVFSFNDIGYVKDDEKDSLDANDILEGLREGNEEANSERRERGWDTLQIVGWEKPPFYDPRTNNLTWAIKAQSGGDVSANYSVRLLGRGGVMNADLVLGVEDMAAAVPQFDGILSAFAFTPGNRYAEFRSGDKIATYGLTALVAGGVGAAALKTGFLAKFWKLLVVGAVALVGALRKLVASVFGRKEGSAESA